METYLITVDGKRTKLDEDPLKTGKTLNELYRLMDCDMVERVAFPWGEMWCDEEGLLKSRPCNTEATRLIHLAFPYYGNVIVGPVVCRVKKGRELP